MTSSITPKVCRPGSLERMVSLLTDGIAAAEGAQAIMELYFENQDRDPHNNDNYCRLVDWLKAARRHRDEQANSYSMAYCPPYKAA
jgi:hypothetical protein